MSSIGSSENLESYRILILGESFSEVDARSEKNSHLKGYPPVNAALRLFAERADCVILNLDSSLMGSANKGSALGKSLEQLGVSAVNLANKRVLDLGESGLQSTFGDLSSLGVDFFGAGNNLEDARKPYRIRLPHRVGGGEVCLHGGLEFSSGLAKYRNVFAGEESSGCSPLGVSSVPPAHHPCTQRASLHVMLPHWGTNGEWRTHKQFELAHRFLAKNYDLVLGTGTHSIQEVHRKRERWVVYGIGNGAGRFSAQQGGSAHQTEVSPFSFWTLLEVHRKAEHRWLSLKLYPVTAVDRQQGSALAPVSPDDFHRVVEALSSRPLRPWRFENSAQSVGRDSLGHFIELDIGPWPEGLRPSRLAASLASGDAGDWPLRSPSTQVEDRVLSLNKHLGANLLTIGAEAAGGTTRWVSYESAILRVGSKSMLAFRYNAHESALGATIVNDKVLTAELLEEAGVRTPSTFLVASAEEAVSAASALGGLVVVKPRDGVKSNGVSIGLRDAQEVQEAYVFARKFGSQIIVQPHIEMYEELRVMASPNKAVAVNGRLLPHVVGDGESTIEQLIKDKNLQRTLNPSLRSRPIPIDALTRRWLKLRGLTLEFIPPLGEQVTVRNVAGLSVGGDTNQILEETESRIKDLAVAAVAAIPGLGWGGVDVLIEKETGDPYVIEINARAAYGAALFPAYGEPRDVAAEVWRLRYADTAPASDMAPQLPSLNTVRLPIVVQSQKRRGRRVRFNRLFPESLVRQNYGVEWRSRQVFQVAMRNAEMVWATRNGDTAEDRAAVRSILRKHELVSRLLRYSKVPRTSRRLVTSLGQLRGFAKKHGESLVLIPRSTWWKSARNRMATSEEIQSLSSLPNSVWVQSSPSGLRFRVLASQDKVWVVSTADKRQTLDALSVELASKVAIQAVRAVPELRWGAVDVVLPKTSDQEMYGPALVEGVIAELSYTAEDTIVAGDFDAFCLWIVEGKSH